MPLPKANGQSIVRTSALKLHRQRHYLAENMIVSCCPIQDIFEGMLFFFVSAGESRLIFDSKRDIRNTDQPL